MFTRNRNSKRAQFAITGIYLKKNVKIHVDYFYEGKYLQNKLIESKIIVFVYNLGMLLLKIKPQPSINQHKKAEYKGFHMSYYLFLYQQWFLQNLGKRTRKILLMPTNMLIDHSRFEKVTYLEIPLFLTAGTSKSYKSLDYRLPRLFTILLH